MNNPLNTFFKYLGFVVVQLALASCIFNNSKENQQGALHFRISIESRSYFHQIADSAFVTVTGMDMHTVKIPLTIDDSTLTGVAADVPSGKKKTFEISVLDSTGTLVYYGKDSSTINPGADNPIHIKVYRETGKATINGIVSDAPISFSGLVSYYTFNETAKDSIGDNHGQLRGSPTSISDRIGKANLAYYFGKNNYITLPNLGLTGDVSVFGWVKIDSTSTHPIVALLSQGESGGMRWHLETQPNYLVYYDRRGEDNAP